MTELVVPRTGIYVCSVCGKTLGFGRLEGESFFSIKCRYCKAIRRVVARV